jgi:hypothetical protein
MLNKVKSKPINPKNYKIDRKVKENDRFVTNFLMKEPIQLSILDNELFHCIPCRRCLIRYFLLSTKKRGFLIVANQEAFKPIYLIER